MIYAKVETEEKKAEIEAALKDAKKVFWYRRLKVIQLSGQGKSVPELAKLFDVCEAVVRRYIHLYNEGGLEKILPVPIPGRPRLLSQLDGEWEEILHKSPSHYEKLQTKGRRWTLQLLVSYEFTNDEASYGRCVLRYRNYNCHSFCGTKAARSTFR